MQHAGNKQRGPYRPSDNPVEVVSPEDHTGGGVGGLVLNTEASPLSVVGARRHGSDEEGQHVHHGVDLTRDAHVEEHDGTDEHAKEADQQEVANRVGVVIRKGDGRGVLVILHTISICQPSCAPSTTTCPAAVHDIAARLEKRQCGKGTMKYGDERDCAQVNLNYKDGAHA